MATVIRATPKAADLPDPNRMRGGGDYNELDVPGDYEVKLESFSDYKTDNSKGWKFEYSCETPSGGSVPFTVWIPYNQLWKITQHFTALGDPSEEGVERDYDPTPLVGNMCAAHIDFPRDVMGQPTSKYREIRHVFPIPEDDEIQVLADATETSVPEPEDLPDEVEIL